MLRSSCCCRKSQMMPVVVIDALLPISVLLLEDRDADAVSIVCCISPCRCFRRYLMHCCRSACCCWKYQKMPIVVRALFSLSVLLLTSHRGCLVPLFDALLPFSVLLWKSPDTASCCSMHCFRQRVVAARVQKMPLVV